MPLSRKDFVDGTNIPKVSLLGDGRASLMDYPDCNGSIAPIPCGHILERRSKQPLLQASKPTLKDIPLVHHPQESKTMSDTLCFKVMPEKYDGTTDFDDYEDRFSCIANLNSWDYKTKTLMLTVMLYESARTFYTTLPDFVRSDYVQLVQRLKQRFGSTAKHPIIWASELDERVRKVGESAANFADEIFLLVKRAYPTGMTYNNLQQLALQYFYKSLEPKMKYTCIERECTELRQAVEIVDLYESIVGRYETLSNADNDDNLTKLQVDLVNKLEPRTEPQRNTRSSRPILGKRCVYDIQAKENQSSSDLIILKKTKNNSNKRCYACNSKFHLIRHCSFIKKINTHL